MISRRAKVSDIQSLLPLVQEFVAESAWGWEYDAEQAKNTLHAYTTNDETVVVFIEENGAPVAFAMLAFDNEFHKERIGYVSKFFVSKAGRKTGAARMLVDCANTWFDLMGCVNVFATATANIKTEGKSFNNLMAKFGYKDCGETLVRGSL